MSINETDMRINLESFQRILKDVDSNQSIVISKNEITFGWDSGAKEVAKELDRLLTIFYEE